MMAYSRPATMWKVLTVVLSKGPAPLTTAPSEASSVIQTRSSLTREGRRTALTLHDCWCPGLRVSFTVMMAEPSSRAESTPVVPPTDTVPGLPDSQA